MKLRDDFWPRLRRNWRWALRAIVAGMILLPFAAIEWVLIEGAGLLQRAGDWFYDVAFRDGGPVDRLNDWVGKPEELERQAVADQHGEIS